MNSDFFKSLIVKILLMTLSPIAVKLHLDGSTTTAIVTDVVDALVLFYGAWSHWNMIKVPAPTGVNPPINMTPVIALLALLPLLGGCANCPNCSFGQQFQANLLAANTFANKYGPIIGKDLVMIGNIIVQAECSTALAASTSAATNVLSIVAPSSKSAATVATILNTNLHVANQLCPLVAAIKTQVGQVPAGVPSQVITETVAVK